MTVACPAPDAGLGVALRLSTYVDCQARALGENGFQALIGGPVMAGLLSGLVTIFIALIGYRLILGHAISLRDTVGWTVRLGMVLTLITAWPAFQTLVYDVAVDGPNELAALLLPASGLPAADLDGRIQDAYDTMRLGVTPQPTPSPTPIVPPNAGSTLPNATPQLQVAPSPSGQLPQTASVFVISTSGVVAALRIAIGFLLAVAPLAILALLFDATLGVFSGWVRALAGAALALVAATVVTAIDLVMIEGELANLQTYGQGLVSEAVDQQALPTLVLLFAITMLIAVAVAARMAGAFSLRPTAVFAPASAGSSVVTETRASSMLYPAQSSVLTRPPITERPRAATIADALALTVAREQYTGAGMPGGSPSGAPSRSLLIGQAAAPDRSTATGLPSPLGSARRGLGRRSRRAAARDRAS